MPAPTSGAPPPSGATLAPGIEPFDPYALPSGMPTLPPPLGVPPSTTPPPGAVPPWPAPGAMPPPYSPYPTPNPYGSTGATWGSQPGAPYFPNGIMPSTTGAPNERFFQDTGGTFTWLYGDGDGYSLGITEIDLSTTAFFKNFLGGTGPLRVTPGFTFDFLNGPSPPAVLSLPPVLYSAYLDFGWRPQFTPQLGAEFAVRPGIYSDFTTVTSDSLRVIASGVGVVRVTPACSAKLGALYLDRNDIKLLPVIGVVWDPNAQTHWDITFPYPKLACYWKTKGNVQTWSYIGAEYGGGAWTFDRENPPDVGASDQLDINDIRVYVGLDWTSLNRFHSFAEVGYVFNRQIVDVLVPEQSLDLDDTIMLRAGIHW